MKHNIRGFTFPSPILRKEPRTGQIWRVHEAWTVAWEDAEGKREFTIPCGFTTDLMTSPLKPAGDETLASILHDGLYVFQPEWCSRDYADEAFYSLLIQNGTSQELAIHLYFAVQAFGFIFWEKRKRAGAAM